MMILSIIDYLYNQLQLRVCGACFVFLWTTDHQNGNEAQSGFGMGDLGQGTHANRQIRLQGLVSAGLDPGPSRIVYIGTILCP